jgi:hypothetical protein
VTIIKTAPAQSRADVRVEGELVVLILNGVATTMPYQAADAIVQRLSAAARLAEERVKHEQVQADHALLTRAGFGIGVTNDPRIAAAAERDAAWDSKLRRYLPGGVRSKTRIGVPAIHLGGLPDAAEDKTR